MRKLFILIGRCTTKSLRHNDLRCLPALIALTALPLSILSCERPYIDDDFATRTAIDSTAIDSATTIFIIGDTDWAGTIDFVFSFSEKGGQK